MSPDPADRLSAALADRYRLERELGRGGMATVFLAHDLKHDRRVALKLLHAELAQTVGPERFQREIRLAARLQHPHLLPVFDSGDTGAGQLWFTMPFVDGESLRDRLRRERQLAQYEALRIAGEAAQALQYAHEQGVIHRDLKPENILLTRDGSTLVADFGVAQALSGAEALTATGLAVGTPAYMSPEQATGQAKLDVRTDIYSLGCVLYEMLVGEPPFTGANVQAILAKRFSTTPTPVRVLRPEVPRPVEAVVERALARVPADRFASAAELRSALQSVGGTASAAATVVTARTRTGWERRALLGSALALALLGAAWWRFGGARPTQRVERIAVLPIENATRDTSRDYLADGLTRELIASLTAADLHVIGYRSVAHYRGMQVSLRQVGDDLGVDAVALGSILRAGDQVQVSLELTDPRSGENLWAETYTARPDEVPGLSNRAARTLAARLGTGVSPERTARLARTPKVDPEAYAAYLRGKAQAERYTREDLHRSIANFEHAVAVDSGFAPAWAGLGYVLEIGINYDFLPPGAHRRAADAIKRALALDSTTALAYLAKGWLLLQRDLDFGAADGAYRTAIGLAPTSEAYQMYGWFLDEHRGRYDEAVRMLERAVALDPSSPLMHTDLAWRLTASGQLDRAREAVRVAKAVDSTYPESEMALAAVHLEASRYDSALAEVSRYEARSGRRVAGLRGRILAGLGRTGEVRALLRAMEREPGPESLGNRATLLLALGQPDSALALLGTAADQGQWWAGFNFRWAPLRDDPRYQALLRRMGAVP
ncbi:MAG TPA: protein kinase [Gemmatimonadales bacterium]|nr:protein kinase [Gemmatimonadales bacterium]